MRKYLAIIFAFIISSQTFFAFANSASADNTPRNIFAFKENEVPEIYLTNQSAPMYLLLPSTNPAHAEIVKALSETKAIKLSKYDKDSGVDTGFFVKSKEGRSLINLRPGNIIEIDGVPFGTTARQYNRLVGLGNDDYDDLKAIAQWCAFMNYLNITKIEYSPSAENALREIPAENVRIAAKELHSLEAKNSKRVFPGSLELEKWSNRIKVVYTFENGNQYTVYANNSFLFIESGGMSYTCQYSGDYSGYVKRVRELAEKPIKADAEESSANEKDAAEK